MTRIDPRPLSAFATAAAIVLSIKLLGLVLDPSLRFFLGDSASYLHTALTGWIPPDRSFLYGWLIGATAVPAQSATTLVLVQTLFGALGALLLYAWLALGLRVPARIATVAAALFALEPAQLFYERMMMAEATGLLAFLGFFAALSLYVARGKWRWIALYAVLGVAAVALRISFMPVVLVLSLGAPAVRALCTRQLDAGRPWVAWGRFALHFAIGLACTLQAHGFYKRWYGELNASEPAYTAHAGMFRLGLVAPLVTREHFRNTGASPAVLDEVTLALDDPRNRESHIWVEGGLFDVLKKHAPDPERAARKISIRAARDNPLGLLGMGLATVADYFDAGIVAHRLHDDTGRRALEADMLADVRTRLHYEATGIEAAHTPATRWFTLGAPWLVACLLLLAPLAVLALWTGRRESGLGLRVLLALTSLGLVAGHVLFSHIVSFRYLHPLPWFVLANLALLAQVYFARNTHRRELA